MKVKRVWNGLIHRVRSVPTPVRLVAGLFLLVLAGCGAEAPVAPTLEVLALDRSSLYFGDGPAAAPGTSVDPSVAAEMNAKIELLEQEIQDLQEDLLAERVAFDAAYGRHYERFLREREARKDLVGGGIAEKGGWLGELNDLMLAAGEGQSANLERLAQRREVAIDEDQEIRAERRRLDRAEGVMAERESGLGFERELKELLEFRVASDLDSEIDELTRWESALASGLAADTGVLEGEVATLTQAEARLRSSVGRSGERVDGLTADYAARTTQVRGYLECGAEVHGLLLALAGWPEQYRMWPSVEEPVTGYRFSISIQNLIGRCTE